MANAVAKSSTPRPAGLPAWLRWRWEMAALALGAVISVWWLWPQEPAPPPPPLTAPIVRGDIEDAIAASGRLMAAGLVDVGAQVSGQLKKLHAKRGDRVLAGDLLAEIDDFVQRSRVAAAQASLEALEAETYSIEAGLKLSQAELERQTRLMAERATTEVEYDRASVSLAQAEAILARHLLSIEQATASLQEAQALLQYARITAPSSGTVVEVLVREGQTLNAAQVTPVILRIGELSTIRVVANIAEPDVVRLAPGMQAYFTTLSGGTRRWYARLEEIAPLPNSDAVSGVAHFDGLLEVDNADGTLLPGIGAKVFFLVESARGILKVPLGALTYSDGYGMVSAAGQYARFDRGEQTADGLTPSVEDGGAALSAASPGNTGNADSQTIDSRPTAAPLSRTATVQVFGQGGQLVLREIRVGRSNAVEAEVLSGLAEGERVVVGVSGRGTAGQIGGLSRGR
ncbi:efflux RND transporter periplasmic adaptor subunit [Candidatus Foliamicus sp.]